MNWTALVPLKRAGERKTRLVGRMSADARDALTDQMFGHVVAALRQVGEIDRLAVLSDRPPWSTHHIWLADRGRGLNHELGEARALLGGGPLLVVHGDLPALCPDDVRMMLGEALQAGCAIAPDRHRRGTNAVALADGRAFQFRFGEDSFNCHCTEAGDACRIVERFGIALDVDTPDDFDLARSASAPGIAWPTARLSRPSAPC